MSVDNFEGMGVDAPFREGTPFESDVSRIFKEEEKALDNGGPRGGTLLDYPDLKALGPEIGRLDRLYEVYAADKSSDNLNLLIAEVGRYTIRVTLNKGGAFREYLNQRVTDHSGASELSQDVAIKVWTNLDKFDGRSKFSSWVYRVAQNCLKDSCRSIASRREVSIFEWKDYENEGSGCSRGASGEPADGGMEVTGGSKILLPDGNAPDRAKKYDLEELIGELKPEDKRIASLFLFDDYTPRELGERFGKDAKWASNQLNRIKKILKKLAEEHYPEMKVAKKRSPSVLVMKGAKSLPASQAA